KWLHPFLSYNFHFSWPLKANAESMLNAESMVVASFSFLQLHCYAQRHAGTPCRTLPDRNRLLVSLQAKDD
ncbi:hypothetical protein VIGAN_04197600, partial [Vigna angularis var. angularis]